MSTEWRQRISRTQIGALSLLLLVGGLVIAASSKRSLDRASIVRAQNKMKELARACQSYASDHEGLLPLEDAPGIDDWITVSKPAAEEVWYNALPKILEARSVSELAAKSRLQFYQPSYPLFFPRAPYPKPEQQVLSLQFAVAMNSRIQANERVRMKEVQIPSRTVLFLERGLRDEEKESEGQRGFTGDPKAYPRSFVARRKGKGFLAFFDGHVELVSLRSFLEDSGRLREPHRYHWTLEPVETE